MPKEQEKQVLVVPDFMTVRDLADMMSTSPINVMKQLIANGIMASINQQIDYDTAAIILEEMGFAAKPLREVEELKKQEEIEAQRPKWRKELYQDETDAQLERRPPVVTILGHVDHGKTSLLDVIRKTHVAEGEAGGITQHIGAYQVKHGDRLITFLDTPGHEAFTAMRARGAQGADVAVLVVAADDGVMPTTREALAHARAAGVPIVVALNKVDKPNANPELVKQQLSELELTPDEWGGDTLVIPVSARTKLGIENLLEAILLVSEDTEIIANPNSKAAGVVLEGRTETGRGPIATLLVQNGTLRRGDVIIAGTTYGRIKMMFDERGREITEAGPSTPITVMGLSTPPSSGERFEVVKDIRTARDMVEVREDEVAAKNVPEARQALTLEAFFQRMQQQGNKELLLIVKVDTFGSLEPVTKSLEDLSNDEVKVRILHADIGNITENDINLASASAAIVIGFNVDVDGAAERTGTSVGVDIRTYDIIYKMIEDVDKALKGMLDPVYEDKVIGTAEVRQVFKISKVGQVAGSFVREGTVRRNAKARVLRGGHPITQLLSVSSLKRFNEDVREVKAGFECGIALERFAEFRDGDLIEFIVKERVT